MSVRERSCVHLAAHRADDRLAQGGGRSDAPARAGAARPGGTVGQGPHRDPRPVAAAHLAPPQAARRGRPDRPLPRGRLGVLPADRRAAPARSSAATSWRWPTRAIPVLARDRDRLAGDQARPCRDGAPLFRRQCRRMGHDPRAARRRGPRRGGDPQGASAAGISAACSISAPAPGGCSSCSRRSTTARSASTPRPTCWRSPAPISTGRASRNAQVRLGDIYNLPFPRDGFDVVTIHQVLHYPRRSRARALPRRRGCSGPAAGC